MPAPDTANPSLVGRVAGRAGVDPAGFKLLQQEIGMASKALSTGLLAGVIELGVGSSKVKAIWESIKWGALARAGLAGFAVLAGGALALTGALRKGVKESGLLQAAIDRMNTSKVLGDQFKSFLGGVEAARKRVAELYQFTASSKFDLSEVSDASKALTVLSNGARGGTSDLELMEKVAKATGTGISEVALTYGRLVEATRNGESIDSSIASLKQMGVVTEATANRLAGMSRSGSSASAIMREVDSEFKRVSDSAGELPQTIGELETAIEKARNAMAEKFGAAWVDPERQGLEASLKVWNALAPAAGKFGRNLATITGPAEKLKNSIKETVAESKLFKNIANTAATMAVTLPAVAGLYAMGKGAKRAAKTISNAPRLSDLLPMGQQGLWTSAWKLEKGAAAASNTVTKNVLTGAARGVDLLASGLGHLSTTVIPKVLAGGRLLVGFLGRILPATAILTTAAWLAAKAWDAYADSQERAADAKGMNDAVDASNAKLKEQLALLKTLDDKRALVATKQDDLNVALKKQADVRSDPNATTAQREAADRTVNALRRDVDQVSEGDESKLGMGKSELENAERVRDVRREIKELMWQAEFGTADAAKQALMLAERRRDALEDAAEAVKAASAKPLIEAAESRKSKADAGAVEVARGLEGERKNLIAERDRIATQVLRGGRVDEGPVPEGFLDVLKGELTTIDQKIAANITAWAGLTDDQRKAAEELEAALSGGSKADKLRLQSETAAGIGDNAGASRLMEESKEQRLKEESAASRAAETEAELRPRRAAARNARQDTITTERAAAVDLQGFGAEDKLDQVKLDAIADQRGRLLPVNENDPLAKAERENQERNFSIQEKEIRRDITERARLRARETAAWQAAIDAQKLNATAITEAVKGNYSAAEASRKAAMKIEDAASDVVRREQLRLDGKSPLEIDKMVGDEKKQREQERVDRRENFRIQRTREIEGMELEQGAARGQAGSRDKLQAFKDSEQLRSLINEGIDNNMSAEDSTKLANRQIMASMTPGQGGTQGQGSMGDSLTAIGGGGGFYAGASNDPQIGELKRISELTRVTNTILQQIKDKKVGVN